MANQGRQQGGGEVLIMFLPDELLAQCLQGSSTLAAVSRGIRGRVQTISAQYPLRLLIKINYQKYSGLWAYVKLSEWCTAAQSTGLNIGELIVVGLEIGEIVPHLAPEQWFHFQNLCLSLPKLHTVHLDGIRHARRVMLSEIACLRCTATKLLQTVDARSENHRGRHRSAFQGSMYKDVCISLRSAQLHRRRVMKRLRNRLVGGSG
jgi:hypothetical protein